METIDIQELETNNPRYSEADLLSEHEILQFNHFKTETTLFNKFKQDTQFNIMEDNAEDSKAILQKKINKYQGFNKFAKEVQKDEKKINSSNKIFSLFKSKKVIKVEQPDNQQTFA